MSVFDPRTAAGSKLSSEWRRYVKTALSCSRSKSVLEVEPTEYVCGRCTVMILRFQLAEDIPPNGFVLFDLPQGWGGWSSEKDIDFLVNAGTLVVSSSEGNVLPFRIISRGSRLSIVEVFFPDGAPADDVITVELPSLLPCERPGRYDLHVFASSADLSPCPIQSPELIVRPGAFDGFDLIYPSSSSIDSTFTLTLRARSGPESAYAAVSDFPNEIDVRGDGIEGLPKRARIHIGNGRNSRIEGLRLSKNQGRFRALWKSGSVVGHPVVRSDLTEGYQVLFGDLHLHTALSDGMGTPEEACEWARYQAGLDFIALNDHIEDRLTYGGPWNEEQWRGLLNRADIYNDPGSFVTLPGLEICGSINLYFRDRSFPFFPLQELDGNPERIGKFLTEISSDDRVLFGYHKLQALTEDYLRFPPPSLLELVQHKRDPAVGLERFLPLCRKPPAFLGGTDSHSGLAGSPPMGLSRKEAQYGLTGVLAENRTRDSVFQALRFGRTFATTGQRSILLFRINRILQGGICSLEPGEPLELSLLLRACNRVDKVELLSVEGTIWQESPGTDEVDLCTIVRDPQLPYDNGRCYLYLRILEQPGRMAWSSPILIKLTPRR
jgi:hypothetical protein